MMPFSEWLTRMLVGERRQWSDELGWWPPDVDEEDGWVIDID
jgi:hypothetical protein